MLEFYPQIKWVHIGAITASGLLFVVRFTLLQCGRSVAMAWPVRHLSYLIDTILLTAALMLVTILHQYPFVHPWLTAKVLLLVAYIGLGSYSFTRATNRTAQVTSGLAAIGVYATIVSVAKAHHPLGFLVGKLS